MKKKKNGGNKMEDSKYTSYQGMMAKVDAALSGMEDICGSLEMAETRKVLAQSREKLESHRFSVGIMGEFKRGKSTVINSLLEQEIMPADILPCSATMNRVTYDMQPHVELRMIDGSVRKIAVEELSSYVTKITSENESRASKVDEAVVYYPCRFCQNGVDIIDTPGLNDNERMNRISEDTIPKLDAVIMVLLHDNPFSISEAEFVRNKLMSSDLGRIIFLVNKMDAVRRPEDKHRIVDEIKKKIQATVLEKMADMYGADSKQYHDAKTKLGNIRIFPFSALDALEGKQAGDEAMIDRSGTRVFEAALTKMLTEERGALELGAPISVIQRTVLDIQKTIQIRRDGLAMSAAEFEKRQAEALQRIQDLRAKKKAEQRNLSKRSKEVQGDLKTRTSQFYPQLEQRMAGIVDGFHPDPAPFAKPEGQKEGSAQLQSQVTAEMNAAVSNFSERIVMELQDIIGQEALAVAKFTSSVEEQLDSIRINISSADAKQNTTALVATGVDILTDFAGVYGIGGLVAGYQAAGIKGALVGGGVGLAANLAVAGILTSLSIVGLPMVMVSCAVGTLVSKKFSTAVFGKSIGEKKLNEIKAEMKKNIALAIRDMQAKRDMENWIEQLVIGRFDELSALMDEECEKLLRDTEHSMDAIRKDLVRNETERKSTLKHLDQVENRCIEIVTDLKPVCEKVEAALKEVV